MLTAINLFMRRQRRRLVLLATVLAVSGAVVAAHGAMTAGDMGDGLTMCVAIAEGAALAVAAAMALRHIPARRLVLVAELALPAQAGRGPTGPRARAGPSVTQVFRL